jgi:hypothetical protein
MMNEQLVTGVWAIEERGGSLQGRAVAAAGSALAVRSSNAPVAQIVRFVWHYVQMAIAMELGMLLPVGFILSALGLNGSCRGRPKPPRW